MSISQLFIALVLAASLLAARQAQASDDPLLIRWQAPAGCPGSEDIEEDVRRLTGERLPRRLEAHGIVTPVEERRFRLLLRTRLDGIAGERQLEGDSCASLSRAAAVTMALLLNPGVEPDPTDNESEPSEASSPGLDVLVMAGLSVSTFALPAPEPELMLGTGLERDRMSLLLSAHYGIPQRAALDGQTTAGATLSPLTLRLLGCHDWIIAAPELATCAGASATWVDGKGESIRQPRQGLISWAALDAGIAFGLPLADGIRLKAQGLFGVPLARPRFFIDGVGEVQRPAVATARADLGAVFSIW